MPQQNMSNKPRAETQIRPGAWPAHRYAGNERRCPRILYAAALKAKYDPGSVELRIALNNLWDGQAGISLSEYQRMKKGLNNAD